MKKYIHFLIIFSFVIHSCNNSTNKNKEKKFKDAEKVALKISNSKSKSAENQLVNKESQINTRFHSTTNKQASKPKSQNSDSTYEKLTTNLSSNEKKEIYPIKWKNTYSKDKKWMELYDSSCNFFLKGWKNEFEINSSAQISREELLLAYRKRMENIFYETPSFIEFCVQELEESPKFLAFCEQWKQNVK